MFNQFLWNQSLWNQSTLKSPPTIWLIDGVEQSAAAIEGDRQKFAYLAEESAADKEGDRRKYVEMAGESAEAQQSDRARARRGIN